MHDAMDCDSSECMRGSDSGEDMRDSGEDTRDSGEDMRDSDSGRGSGEDTRDSSEADDTSVEVSSKIFITRFQKIGNSGMVSRFLCLKSTTETHLTPNQRRINAGSAATRASAGRGETLRVSKCASYAFVSLERLVNVSRGPY